MTDKFFAENLLNGDSLPDLTEEDINQVTQNFDLKSNEESIKENVILDDIDVIYEECSDLIEDSCDSTIDSNESCLDEPFEDDQQFFVKKFKRNRNGLLELAYF